MLWGEKRNRCTVNWDNTCTPERPTAAWGVMQVHKINTVVVTFTLEAFPCPALSNYLFPTANQLSLCLVPISTQVNSYSFYLFLFLFSSYGPSVLFTLVRGSRLGPYAINSRLSLRKEPVTPVLSKTTYLPSCQSSVKWFSCRYLQGKRLWWAWPDTCVSAVCQWHIHSCW